MCGQGVECLPDEQAAFNAGVGEAAKVCEQLMELLAKDLDSNVLGKTVAMSEIHTIKTCLRSICALLKK
jgi:hypothetical protein